MDANDKHSFQDDGTGDCAECGEGLHKWVHRTDLTEEEADGLDARAIRYGAIILSLAAERQRQDEKWGEQNHDPFLYLTILGEEVGEACEAALRTRFPGKAEGASLLAEQELRKELVQVAAVAVAMIECLDRGTWKWGGHAK